MDHKESSKIRFVRFFLDVEDKRDIITLPRGILRLIIFIISTILLATKILWNFLKFPTSIDIYSDNFISSMILHVSGNFKLFRIFVVVNFLRYKDLR